MNYTDTFNVKDIDPLRLKARAMVEATPIFKNKSARRNRSFQQVIAMCMKGQSAELFLIDKCGYQDDTRNYYDVKRPDGEAIEVKVSDYTKTHWESILADLEYKIGVYGFNIPSIVYLYQHDKKTGDISFFNEYELNEGNEYEEKQR